MATKLEKGFDVKGGKVVLDRKKILATLPVNKRIAAQRGNSTKIRVSKPVLRIPAGKRDE